MSNKNDLFILRGHIGELPELDQDMIASYYGDIKALAGKDFSNASYALALALIMLELSVAQEG